MNNNTNSLIRHKNPEELIRFLREQNESRILIKDDKKFVKSPISRWQNILENISQFDFKTQPNNKALGSKIVFIVGLPRAGKTTIGDILSQTKLCKSFDEIYSLSEFIGNIVGPDGKKYKYPDYLQKLDDRIFPDMAIDFLKSLEKKTDKTDNIILNTMPNNYLYLPIIYKMLPGAKVIWCHRSVPKHLGAMYAKNFKHSYWNFTDRPKDLVESYYVYKQMYNSYMKYIPHYIFNLNFEDIVYDFESTIKNLLTSMSIEISKKDLKIIIENNSDHINNLAFEDQMIEKYLPYLPEFL